MKMTALRWAQDPSLFFSQQKMSVIWYVETFFQTSTDPMAPSQAVQEMSCETSSFTHVTYNRNILSWQNFRNSNMNSLISSS